LKVRFGFLAILAPATLPLVVPGIVRADVAFSPTPPHQQVLSAFLFAVPNAFISAGVAVLAVYALRRLRAALRRGASVPEPAVAVPAFGGDAPWRKKRSLFLVALGIAFAVWLPLLCAFTWRSVEEQQRDYVEAQREKMERLRRFEEPLPPVRQLAKTDSVMEKTRTEEVFVGTVIETMSSGGYTYVQVDNGKEKIWAAAPQFKVAAGEKVSVPKGLPMRNYHSAALNRDFPLVNFVGSIGGDKVSSMSARDLSAEGSSEPEDVPLPEGRHPKTVAAGSVEEAKASPAGIRRVGEIIAWRSDLSGKEVSVRGRVVKYTPQVMGKNWLHIQDGSGPAGSNDLTVTTDAEAKVGDAVLVKGVITTNKDFGMGYKINVIIEDAKITAE
jgi:hypothetical protein